MTVSKKFPGSRQRRRKWSEVKETGGGEQWTRETGEHRTREGEERTRRGKEGKVEKRRVGLDSKGEQLERKAWDKNSKK